MEQLMLQISKVVSVKVWANDPYWYVETIRQYDATTPAYTSIRKFPLPEFSGDGAPGRVPPLEVVPSRPG